MNHDLLWWTAALTTGVVGSLHCVGMCGPLAMALPIGRLPRPKRGLAVGFYHLSRLMAYAGLGLLMGTVGQGLLLTGLQRPVSITAGLFLLLWTLTNRGKLPGLPLSRATRWVVHPMTRLLNSPTLRAFAGLGFLNGLLPCGFVYVALTGAITTENAATGALYMALFGLGTVPALLAVRFLPILLPTSVRRRISAALPVTTVGLAMLLLVRGIYNPTVINKANQTIPICHDVQSIVTRVGQGSDGTDNEMVK
ncbi:sulfite exporter TauE/SafE family protein [Spirosoma arcticum]